MMRPVEVHHEGRWVAATLLATRRGADGWEGLVGYTDPDTRQGFYHWCPEVMLREPLEAAASDPVERRGVRRQL